MPTSMSLALRFTEVHQNQVTDLAALVPGPLATPAGTGTTAPRGAVWPLCCLLPDLYSLMLSFLLAAWSLGHLSWRQRQGPTPGRACVGLHWGQSLQDTVPLVLTTAGL